VRSRRTAGRLRTLGTGLCTALLLAGGIGCSSVEAVRLPGAQPVQRVLVAPFRDDRCYRALRDYVLFGTTGCENPGPVVARHLGRGLESQGLHEVVPEGQARPVLRKMSLSGAYPMDEEWLAAARVLGSSGVVVGEVRRYRSLWVLFFQVASVAFEARCLEAATGKEVWRVRARGWAPFAAEERLVQKRCNEACAALKEKLAAPQK